MLRVRMPCFIRGMRAFILTRERVYAAMQEETQKSGEKYFAVSLFGVDS